MISFEGGNIKTTNKLILTIRSKKQQQEVLALHQTCQDSLVSSQQTRQRASQSCSVLQER